MAGRLFDAVRGYIRNYPEEVAEVAGVEMKLASVTSREVEEIAKMLDKMLYREATPAIRELFTENFDLVIDLIRAVKTETKQEFAGVRARGNQLTLVDLTADQFTNVWGATGKVDFTYTATATGAVDYLGTEAAPETVAEEEGYLILGFVELSTSPKINKTQLTKNGDKYVWNNVKFEVDENFYVASLTEPWFFPPESNFYVQMNFYKTGKVETIPIGIKAVQAKNIMSL
jgi:hypothetical protein